MARGFARRRRNPNRRTPYNPKNRPVGHRQAISRTAANLLKYSRMTLAPAARERLIFTCRFAHRCGYCNFTLVAGRDDLVDSFLRAIALELQALGGPLVVDTVFLGGGTPTHLPLPALERLLQIVRGSFTLPPGYEFSVEANPVDINAPLLKMLADHGVNRLSLGVQSFDAAKLRLLERDHSPDDARSACELALAHLPSVSLDLIFGVPGESRAVWRHDLASALALGRNISRPMV